MRTITLIARNRPTYTAQALEGIVKAIIGAEGEDGQGVPYDRLLISIDPTDSGVDSATEKVCEKACEMISDAGIIECTIYVNKQPMEVGGNHLIALQRAFEEHESDFNVLVEDDAVLMPDALRLANWFEENHGSQMSEYLLFAMCNHRDFGPEQKTIPGEPSYLAESSHIPSPFAWAATKWQWPFLKCTWNKKVVLPVGWDFSTSFAMRLCRRKALHPVLSRCQNIGRDGGTHESPETFDKTQLGLRYSDGNYEGPYKIVARIPNEELLKLDGWMLPEYSEMFPR